LLGCCFGLRLRAKDCAEDRASARRPALLWQKREQRFRLTKLARLDRNISRNSYGEREPRSKITLAQHL
jgi:hypothetical protein